MKDILDILIERTMNEEEKGGVEKKAAAPKSVDNLGLDLAEIANILVTGTETDKILESSGAALKTLMAGGDINIDLSSAQSLADSFSFLDFKSQEVLNERCSSLGGLVSKIALASGLISILEQFNAASAGFVNEAFIATLMGGESVPVGGGGIEDIVVGDVGISLKVKATTKLGGSFGNLLETLSIRYVQAYTLKGSRESSPVRTIRNSTETEKIKLSPRKRLIYVKPDTTPIHAGGLYYLTFVKKSDGMTVAAYKITAQDIIGSATPDENGFYNIQDLNNVLESEIPDVAEKAFYQIGTPLTPQSFNEVLRGEMAEVFESLSVLDAWYGQMKQKIVGYISTLEKSNFDELQNHLNSGSEFNFKAFSTNSCPDNMMEQKQKKLHFSLDKLIEEVIINKDK